MTERRARKNTKYNFIMANIQKIEQPKALTISDPEYVRLVTQISDIWDGAREQAFNAVNTSLLMANWKTGEYIVEFEQKGNVKAEYGKQLLTNLSKDLTRLRGKGYSRSNLFNMRLFYVRFPKIQTVSGQLTWSHYLELLKCYLLHAISCICPTKKNCKSNLIAC